METINLFALLAKWGELSLHVGNPAWEKQYRNYRHDFRDNEESGLKNCLLAQMMPVLDQLDADEVKIQTDGFKNGEIEAGMRGLGLLLNAPFDRELRGILALCVLNQVELPPTKDTIRFLESEEVVLDPEHSWTQDQFIQLLNRGDCTTFMLYFRRWFANREISVNIRSKWAFILWRSYLREQHVWPKSSVRYKAKRNQKSWIKIWKIGKKNLKSDFSSFFYIFLEKCKGGK